MELVETELAIPFKEVVNGRTDPIRSSECSGAVWAPVRIVQEPVKSAPSQTCHSPKPETMALPVTVGQET